jgi:hypothetical protein
MNTIYQELKANQHDEAAVELMLDKLVKDFGPNDGPRKLLDSILELRKDERATDAAFISKLVDMMNDRVLAAKVSGNEIIRCSTCGTYSFWGGHDDNPSFWCCEDCGITFCNTCHHIDNENDECVLCKSCASAPKLTDMERNVFVKRHIEGITLNPLEYMLDAESGKPMIFDDEAAAKAFLLENGETEDDLQWYVFKTVADELRESIANFKKDGITLERIMEELECREHAGDGAGKLHGWDDALCEFTEDDLIFIAENMKEEKNELFDSL